MGSDFVLKMVHSMTVLALLLGLCAAASAVPKRGLSGLGSCHDASALKLQQSWHYNWGHVPQKCAQPIAAEFVPMIWGCWGNCTSGLPADYAETWRAAGVRFLLGFNEPDNPSQSNLSPAAAAAFWPQLQVLAAEFDPPLTLVAPAMTHWNSTTGRSLWLDQFMSNCSTVVEQCEPALIKFVAFHDYGGSADGIISRSDSAAAIYGGRPVWLTEFAVGYGKDRSTNDMFMSQILPQLDASESIFRYAWFSTRNRPGSWVNQSSLLPCHGVPKGSWVKSDHTTCSSNLTWLSKDATLGGCQAAAVNSSACTNPKTVAYQSGDVQNCYCSNAKCNKQTSTWLDLYTQQSVASFSADELDPPSLVPTSTGEIYMGRA